MSVVWACTHCRPVATEWNSARDLGAHLEEFHNHLGATAGPKDSGSASPEALVLLMLKHGVSRLKSGDFEAELGGVRHEVKPQAPQDVARMLRDAMGSDKCKCGHEMTSHGDHGLCLVGCPEDNCEPPRADA